MTKRRKQIPVIGPVKKSRATMRANLIAAGTRLFSERGYASPTLREITKAAGVSLPIVYWFFADKAELYQECCFQLIRDSFETFLKTTNVSEPRDILYLFVKELCANHMNFFSDTRGRVSPLMQRGDNNAYILILALQVVILYSH